MKKKIEGNPLDRGVWKEDSCLRDKTFKVEDYISFSREVSIHVILQMFHIGF